MTKVSLYTRKASKYKLAKPQQAPLNDGQSYVLRYAGTWETLKDVRTYVDAMTGATAKRLEFLSGKQQAIKAERKPKSDDAFDVKKQAYLASVKEHKSHKTWLAYSLALREFYTASQIAQQDYFDGANPVKLAEPAFAPNGTEKALFTRRNWGDAEGSLGAVSYGGGDSCVHGAALWDNRAPTCSTIF